MIFKVNPVDVWVTTIENEPGGLARKLRTLTKAGANFEFTIVRRIVDDPGKRVLFLTPIVGEAQTRAAREDGFRKSESLQSIRVEGVDRPGVSVQIAQALGDAGILVRGLSAAVIGKRFVMFLALDSVADAENAVQILQAMS